MSEEEFREICKMLEQMGFAVYAVSDPWIHNKDKTPLPPKEKTAVKRLVVDWNLEMKRLLKQGK